MQDPTPTQPSERVMVLACIVLFGLALDRVPDDRPTQPPPGVVPTDVPPVEPTQEPPPEPTEPPPPEPTEPPPEPTQEPPEPTQEPPPEPTREPPEGGLPDLPCCAPTALPLFMVPLLLLKRKKSV